MCDEKMFARRICHGILPVRTKRGPCISGFIPEWTLARDVKWVTWWCMKWQMGEPGPYPILLPDFQLSSWLGN